MVMRRETTKKARRMTERVKARKRRRLRPKEKATIDLSFPPIHFRLTIFKE